MIFTRKQSETDQLKKKVVMKHETRVLVTMKSAWLSVVVPCFIHIFRRLVFIMVISMAVFQKLVVVLDLQSQMQK